MASATGVTVRTLAGERRRLVDLDAWALLNLPVDEAIGLAPRIAQTTGTPAATVEATLAGRSVQNLGLLEFYRRFLPNQPTPALMAPATAHYSWPKGAALLGLGRDALRRIHVDLDGRMDTVELRRALDCCLDERRPVLQVVAVIGSTEESAVDPLAQIADIRDEYRQRGLEFTLHADGAWGGYFASMLRKPRIFAAFRKAGLEGSDEEARDVSRWLGADRPDPVAEAGLGEVFDTSEGEMAPGIRLSDYVTGQLRALARCETVTVDPHKSGFIRTRRARCATATAGCATWSPSPRRWSITAASTPRWACTASRDRSRARRPRPSISPQRDSHRPGGLRQAARPVRLLEQALLRRARQHVRTVGPGDAHAVPAPAGRERRALRRSRSRSRSTSSGGRSCRSRTTRWSGSARKTPS